MSSRTIHHATDATLDDYAAALLDEIEDPGLSILASLAACKPFANLDFGKDPVPNVNLVSIPEPQVVVGDFDWKNPRITGEAIGWPWLIVEDWTFRLRHQYRLLSYHTSDARGGFGEIYLSERGQMLIRSRAFPGS
jgi:hypothetical protein